MEGNTFSLLLVLCVTVASAGKPPRDNRVEELKLAHVTREVDLTTALAKEKVTMEVENVGSKAVGYVLYTVEPALAGKVAYINALVRKLRTSIRISYLIKLSFWMFPI